MYYEPDTKSETVHADPPGTRHKIRATLTRLHVLPRFRRPSTRNGVFRRRNSTHTSTTFREYIASTLTQRFRTSAAPQTHHEDPETSLHESLNQAAPVHESTRPQSLAHSLAHTDPQVSDTPADQIACPQHGPEVESLTSTLFPTQPSEQNASQPNSTSEGDYPQPIEPGCSTTLPSTPFQSDESVPEAKSVRFQCFAERCYAATSIAVDGKLQEIFDKGLRQRLCSVLQHLRLNDTRISLECAMIGEIPTVAAMKPTILFMCLTHAQKKAIVTAMSKIDFVPDPFSYKVVIREVKKAGSNIQSQIEGGFIGSPVEVGLPPDTKSLCGAPAKIVMNEEESDVARSTIGGFILVNGFPFALTTAHGFADVAEKRCCDAQEDVFWTKASHTEESIRSFTKAGILHSYGWTDASNDFKNGSSSPRPEAECGSQDWALIDISLKGNPTLENSFLMGKDSVSVTDYFRVEDLSFGDVLVCSGSRGVLRATLGGSTASLIMGRSVFDVRSISLDHELGTESHMLVAFPFSPLKKRR
jgi:hypothetical protein